MNELQTLPVELLTREAFAPFGQVIQKAGARHFPINNGSTERYHDLAQLEVDAQGRVLLSQCVSEPTRLPFVVRKLERHPLGSQAFVPLFGQRFLVVVAAADLQPRAFLASGGQGVNYARGTWHHPLLALDHLSEFLIIDRGGEGDNCEEIELPQHWRLQLGQ